MASLEDTFQAAVDAQVIGGVALMAIDASGKFKYEKTFGNQSLDPSSPASKQSIDLDAVFTLASCTKLMTTIAALQCVEKGLVTFDEDLSPIIKEFSDLQVVSFPDDRDEPIYKKAENEITLRMLLSHQSGFGYDAMSPILSRWRSTRDETASPNGMPLLARISTPLLFHPGTSWEYGTSIDWVGVLISRLTNLSLQDYMQMHIWTPLNIKDMTFHLDHRPDMRAHLVDLSAREGIPNPKLSLGIYPETGKVVHLAEMVYDDPTEDEYGGSGAYGSAREYIKILHSILANDNKLLRPESIDEMFTPQLKPYSKDVYTGFMAMPLWEGTFSSVPVGTGVDFGLGSMLVTSEMGSTGRKKGTMSWSGLPNLLWTIDREAGLACFFAAQLVPFGDKQLHSLQRAFEEEMYKRFEAAGGKESK